MLNIIFNITDVRFFPFRKVRNVRINGFFGSREKFLAPEKKKRNSLFKVVQYMSCYVRIYE